MLRGLKDLYSEITPDELSCLQLQLPDNNIEAIDKLCPHAFLGGALEWSLGSQAALPDIWATTTFDHDGRLVVGEHLDNGGWQQDDWLAARNLARAWTDPDSAAYRYVCDLHLEFDTSSGSTSPMVVAGLYHDPGNTPDRLDAINTYCELVGGTTPDADLKCLVDRIPAEVHLRHVAMMSARGDTAVRLVLTSRTLALPELAVKLGWCGESLDPLTDFLAASHPVVGVQYELCDSVTRIGIELYPRSQSDTHYHARLFEYLVDVGAMESNWGERLLAWMSLDTGSYRDLLIKLTYSSTHAVKGKAYVIFP